MRDITRGALLAIALLFATAPCIGQEESKSHAAPPVKTTFLVIYKPGPAWVAGRPLREQPLQEHGRYILSLYAKGSLRFGGPFADDSGGAAAFEAADQEEAKAIVAADPAVTSQVFVAELHPWALISWKSLLKK